MVMGSFTSLFFFLIFPHTLDYTSVPLLLFVRFVSPRVSDARVWAALKPLFTPVVMVTFLKGFIRSAALI